MAGSGKLAVKATRVDGHKMPQGPREALELELWFWIGDIYGRVVSLGLAAIRGRYPLTKSRPWHRAGGMEKIGGQIVTQGADVLYCFLRSKGAL